jgi:hypothetical protein
MAKTTVKPAAKTTTKTGSSKAKPSASAAVPLEKLSEDALKTLQSLGLDQQLQADLEWCLGSYRSDGNPSGLYETLARTLTVFNTEKAKKTKGVTVKQVGDLEKALKARQ